MDEAQIRVQWRSMGHVGAEKGHLALRQKAAQDGTQAPTLAAVREAIARDATKQVYARKKTLLQGRVAARRPDEVWQLDTLSMEPLSEVKGQQGMTHIVFAVDVFTRRLMATPVKSKDPEEIVEALKRLGVRGGRPSGYL